MSICNTCFDTKTAIASKNNKRAGSWMAASSHFMLSVVRFLLISDAYVACAWHVSATVVVKSFAYAAARRMSSSGSSAVTNLLGI